MSKLGYLVSFVMGGGIASLITWKICEKKYKDIADEEIESVKKAFSKNIQVVVKDKEEKDIPKSKTNEYEELVNKKYRYASKYESALNELKSSAEKEDDTMAPYIITPDEYGELPDYERVNLIYYVEDGVVATETDEVIDDPDDIIGLDSLDHFGEDTEDCIFVRNEKLKTDYEILRDNSSFSEMMGQKSYATEDDDD